MFGIELGWRGSTREYVLLVVAYVLANVAVLVNVLPHLGAAA